MLSLFFFDLVELVTTLFNSDEVIRPFTKLCLLDSSRVIFDPEDIYLRYSKTFSWEDMLLCRMNSLNF